jgi:hypothetical protein
MIGGILAAVAAAAAAAWRDRQRRPPIPHGPELQGDGPGPLDFPHGAECQGCGLHVWNRCAARPCGPHAPVAPPEKNPPERKVHRVPGAW